MRRPPAATPEALDEAATLYRGDLLEGLAVSEPRFEEWLRDIAATQARAGMTTMSKDRHSAGVAQGKTFYERWIRERRG
ncbi:MAG: hypothetical protein HYU41_21250 [Candidatus Rokubacteria bacterium]|nr:hypothetical protein [Candidatus Rokubacteria bacterium]